MSSNQQPPAGPNGSRDTFREHINVPIQIPAWGLLCMLIGAVFTSGTLYQKMDALIESSRTNDQQVSQIRERQIINTAILQTVQEQIRAHDTRLGTLERGAHK